MLSISDTVLGTREEVYGGKHEDGYDSFGLCMTFFELSASTKDDSVFSKVTSLTSMDMDYQL